MTVGFPWERKFRFTVLLSVLLAAVGCSSATYITASVKTNPLDHVAQQAQENWSVERVNANTLHLSDAWPIHSVTSLGYSASYANLCYDENSSVLNVQYYFQSNQLLMLFIPMTLNAEPSLGGAALKPIMNGQIDDILRWSGASVISRRAGENSEVFPPLKANIPSANLSTAPKSE